MTNRPFFSHSVSYFDHSVSYFLWLKDKIKSFVDILYVLDTFFLISEKRSIRLKR